ncbi:hypothetical protein [Paenibacillus sp. 2TAB23]|uniref:hypothetical protein n=1 Tax=Paenibacillus sp. 2TAB23 TaxID=3233004 RepID=UPI003F9B0902
MEQRLLDREAVSAYESRRQDGADAYEASFALNTHAMSICTTKLSLSLRSKFCFKYSCDEYLYHKTKFKLTKQVLL